MKNFVNLLILGLLLHIQDCYASRHLLPLHKKDFKEQEISKVKYCCYDPEIVASYHDGERLTTAVGIGLFGVGCIATACIALSKDEQQLLLLLPAMLPIIQGAYLMIRSYNGARQRFIGKEVCEFMNKKI